MWIAIMEKEHDSWHGWHPWDPTWDFTDVFSCSGHRQAETRTRVVKRVLFRTGHVKQIPMGFLGQTGLMQPMQITWHVNQVHLKHASRNDASQYSCRSSSKHFNPTAWLRQSILQIVISASSLQRLRQLPVTSDDRAQPQQPQFSRPRAQVLHGCCHWVAHLTMGSTDWFKSLEPNEPQICSHWDDPRDVGDLGPHEHRDPNQLWHPGILTRPSSWSENCSKKSSGNSSKRDYTIILNVLNHHQHYHQKITPFLDHPEKKETSKTRVRFAGLRSCHTSAEA